MANISGGDKLDKALAALGRKVSTKATLEVGFMEDAEYPDGTKVALVAALNNFGTSKAPPRPFFSNMVADNRDSWPKKIAILLPKNDYDPVKTLNLLGEDMEGELRDSIDRTNAPPLAESTIARKGFAKPLVHSGLMKRSATHRVKT